MKVRKLAVSEKECIAVTVSVEGGITEYQKAFLKIFNNVRESQDLYHIENYSWCDDITVYGSIGVKKALQEYLEWFGTIKRVETALIYQIEELPDYDDDKYSNQVVMPFSN